MDVACVVGMVGNFPYLKQFLVKLCKQTQGLNIPRYPPPHDRRNHQATALNAHGAYFQKTCFNAILMQVNLIKTAISNNNERSPF